MQRVYITLNGDDKIAIYNLDPTSGNLTHQEDVEVIGGPRHSVFRQTVGMPTAGCAPPNR